MIPTPTVGVMSPGPQPLVSCYSSHLCNPPAGPFCGSPVSLLMVKKPCIATWCRSQETARKGVVPGSYVPFTLTTQPAYIARKRQLLPLQRLLQEGNND